MNSMNEAAAQPRRKPTNLTLDGLADLSEPLDGPLLAATPLSLLSPNALHAKASRSPAPAKSESPGALPSFNNRRSRPDPRRQSSAIFAGFAKATSGAGFLDDDEIAVGDEDILISLPVAAKSQVSGASHSTLWLEPHTEELLEGDLPEPAFDGAAASCGGQEELGFGAALGGGLAPIPESPSCSQGEATADETGTGAALGRSCSSPAQQPGLRPSSRASSRGPSPVKLPSRGATPQKDISTSCRGTSPQKPVSGVRDSTLLSEGLSKLCLEAGFDEWDTDDFELQDGNKVKEMAFLFKMESDAKAASPASSPKFSDATATALASCSASSTGEASSVKEKVGKLLQQEAAATKAAAVEGSARRAAAAKPAVAPSRPAAKAASSAAGSKAANSAARPGKFAPAPGARPSRLRPPSTSSSYFSHSTTGNRAADASKPQQKAQGTSRASAVPAATSTSRTTAAATTQRPASSLRPPVAPSNNATRPATAATASRPATATSGGTPAKGTVSRRPSTAPSPLRPSSSVAHAITSPGRAAQPIFSAAPPVTIQRGSLGGMAGPAASRAAPGRSRLAQSSTAAASSNTPVRAPAAAASGRTDEPHAAGGQTAAPAAEQPRRGMFSQRTMNAAASRLKPPSAPSSNTPTPAPTGQRPTSSGTPVSSLPKLRLGSPAISPSNDNLTPNTARIRFLEQHPELVFGGGSKVGNSPTSEEAEQLVRRKTAQERHLEEWGENL